MENLPDWISALSAFILVIATCIYVVFSYKLTQETKKLREVETSPFISLQLEVFRYSNLLQLVIKNIGKAPAYNVNFSLDEKYSDIFRFNFDTKISYFAPEQAIEAIAKPYKDFLEFNFDSIPVKVTYYSKDNRIISDTFNLEWIHFNGTLIDNNPYEKIEKELKNISKSISDKNESIQRIKIVDFNITDYFLICIFSDGYLGKVPISQSKKLGINSANKLIRSSNGLLDIETNLLYTAEELYYKFKALNRERV